jgi:hypothetical protein
MGKKWNQDYDSERRAEANRKGKQNAAERRAALEARIDEIVARAKAAEYSGGDVFFDRRPLRWRRGCKVG